MKTYRLLIDGKWVSSGTRETYRNTNPATGQALGVFQKGGREDVRLALKAAWRAFPGWRETPAPARGEILFRAASIMESRKKELARALTQENGKNLEESLGEVQEGIDTFKYLAGEGRRLLGETAPSELRSKFCMTIRQPIGVVGLITPWNFPFAIPCWKLAPALVSGNCVVFKPASDTPMMAVRLCEILQEAGLPPGVLNMVTGPGSTVGDELSVNTMSRATSFTGSAQVGRDVYMKGAQKLCRVGLEMGGKNAEIILADANLELALEGAVWGAFGTAGQRCTATSRIILERPIAGKFTRMFLQRVRKIRAGNGLSKGVLVGPIINQAQMERILEYISTGKQEGARLLAGGKRLSGGSLGRGFFIEPTVFGGVKPDMRIAQEEIFGPVVCLMEARDFRDAVRIANSTSYGLSLSIYTRDVNRSFRAMEDLESGIVYVNAPTIGAEVHLPFGGIKNTGNGSREAGTAAIEEFTEVKTVFVDYSDRLQRAQIDI
jgi:acyl-CoA reductase-like NAD-dependent aldehyde dehydrogenase